jgi:hypothetical protein
MFLNARHVGAMYQNRIVCQGQSHSAPNAPKPHSKKLPRGFWALRMRHAQGKFPWTAAGDALRAANWRLPQMSSLIALAMTARYNLRAPDPVL